MGFPQIVHLNYSSCFLIVIILEAQESLMNEFMALNLRHHFLCHFNMLYKSLLSSSVEKYIFKRFVKFQNHVFGGWKLAGIISTLHIRLKVSLQHC